MSQYNKEEQKIIQKHDTWNEWCVFLANYIPTEINKKVGTLIENLYNANLSLSKLEKTFYENNKDLFEDQPNHKLIYERMLEDEDMLQDCLHIVNQWPVFQRVEFLEWYVAEFIDEDTKDKSYSKAVVNRLKQIKKDNNII